MKHILILLTILFAFNPLFSQKDTSQFYNKTLRNNNISIEIGGKALAYSVGYERMIYKSKKFLLTGSINLSYEPFIGFKGIMAPIGIIVLIGENRSKLLFGLTSTSSFDFFNVYPKSRKERLANKVADRYYVPLYNLEFMQPSIGFRRYFKKGNSLSIAVTTIIDIGLDDEGSSDFLPITIFPWIGISYNFKL